MEDVPPEEKTEEFVGALEHAKVSNLEYLTKLEALESAGRDDELALAKLERELRDHIRSEFGLPARPKKAEINRADLARQAGIDPNFELGPVKAKPSHSDGALQTLKFPDELDRIMGKIVADAKLAEQEMGISTLFLSFGFLAFSDDDRIESMFDVLMRAGENVQIIVLTCRKRLFTRLGASPLEIRVAS
jgi:hypothetical protein